MTAIEKGKLDDTQNPKAYLIAITVNLWKSQKKKYAVRNKKANIIYLETDNPEQLADGSESVEERLIREEEERLIRKLVNNLPDKL